MQKPVCLYDITGFFIDKCVKKTINRHTYWLSNTYFYRDKKHLNEDHYY